MIAKSRRSQHKREVTREPSKLILYKSINDSAHLLVLKEGYVMKPSPQ